MTATARQSPQATVLSLAQLLEQQPPTAPPCLVEPGLLPPQGILFVGGEPKVGKSLLVANLALSLAAGSGRTGFSIPAARRVLICQFEFPVPRLSAAWRSCGERWAPPRILISWSTLALPAICSAHPRD